MLSFSPLKCSGYHNDPYLWFTLRTLYDHVLCTVLAVNNTAPMKRRRLLVTVRAVTRAVAAQRCIVTEARLSYRLALGPQTAFYLIYTKGSRLAGVYICPLTAPSSEIQNYNINVNIFVVFDHNIGRTIKYMVSGHLKRLIQGKSVIVAFLSSLENFALSYLKVKLFKVSLYVLMHVLQE